MNELIRVKVNEKQEQLVSAREMHEKLGIAKDFTNWFKQQAERLSLQEGLDFTPFWAESTGGRPSSDYHITIDIAKHIAMISGGEKAHEIRNYFIKVERAWNSPEQVMNRALEYSRQALARAITQIEQDKPKVLFADSVSASRTSILIGELAKLLKQNGVEIGQNRLFEWMRENGYLIRRQGTDYNMPTQYSMELGLFEIKETVINHSDGHTSISKTPKIKGKGQIYFINKFRKEWEN
jgi:anti-repressor protein